MGCTSCRERSFDSSMLKDFPKYYRYIQKKLKSEKFQFKATADGVSLKAKLCAVYGIPKDIAKLWISMYIDYMILAGWNLLLEIRVVVYPPYAIQQVLKLHVTDVENYLKFNAIVTEKKGVINYMPLRFIARQDPEGVDDIKNTYDIAKLYLKKNIYSNPQIYTTFDRLDQAETIWEDFEVTLMQCEFTFCFHDRESKEAFQKVLIDHADELAVRSQTPEEIIRVGKRLRELLGLDELLPSSQEPYRPRIKSATEKKWSLDNAEFSAEFINGLAWEQRISVHEAKQWIDEYQKFVKLISLGGEKTVRIPSEAVDQVWHLHMQHVVLYREKTREFKPIHKCPAKGDVMGMEKNKKDYLETLKAYNTNFGAPNVSIWPVWEQRVNEAGRSASYYFSFGKDCLTQEQRNKVLEKYRGYVKSQPQRQPQQTNEETKENEYDSQFYDQNDRPGDWATIAIVAAAAMTPLLFLDMYDTFFEPAEADLADNFLDIANQNQNEVQDNVEQTANVEVENNDGGGWWSSLFDNNNDTGKDNDGGWWGSWGGDNGDAGGDNGCGGGGCGGGDD